MGKSTSRPVELRGSPDAAGASLAGEIIASREPKGPRVQAGFVVLTPVTAEGDLNIGAKIAIQAQAIFSVEAVALGTPNARSLVHFCGLGANNVQRVLVTQYVEEVLAGIEQAMGPTHFVVPGRGEDQS